MCTVSALDAKAETLARGLFRGYYEKMSFSVSGLPQREFGFGNFERKIAFRHYSFKDAESLKRYVVANVPAFMSFSSSLYRYPDAKPMERKGWLGAEMVFDLDASDLRLKCQAVHGRSWVCDNCLDRVKDETVKLVEDFLVPDFGFSRNEISVNFSGNRGYHVHVNSKEVFGLTSEQRKGMSEYISGMNMNMTAFFPTLGQRGKRLVGPKPADYGWGGRLARGFISALNSGEESLIGLGIDPKMAKRLEASKAEVIFGITTGNWDKINVPKKADFWTNAMKGMAIAQSDSIDRNVTNDTSHLIRMPDTLHGDTGLAGRSLAVGDLGKFNPMDDAVVFGGEPMKVVTEKVPAFRMRGEEHGPFDNAAVELPAYAALYLLLKRVARLA